MDGEIKYRLKFLFQQVDLMTEDFVIGRAQDCNLTLEDPLVSRNHARIRISAEGPAIDDLGSRNGTLVNSVPIFNNYPLSNNDRIRIGSHDLLFLVEKTGLHRSLRTTGAMITCNSCKIPLPLGLSHCPHCNAAIGPRQECPSCHETVSPSEKYCPRCRTRLNIGDPTVPIGLGGNVEGWTDGVVSEVIQKAISQGRYDHAARILAGRIENYEINQNSAGPDLDLLLEISQYTLVLASKLNEPERIDWILHAWLKTGTAMPVSLFESMLITSDMSARLENYLAALRRSGVSEDIIRPLELIRLQGPTGGSSS